MKKVGIVGSRGMVGSVLIERMKEEDDFRNFDTQFFSSSAQGKVALEHSKKKYLFADSKCLTTLYEMDIIVSCQGSEYTREILPKLEEKGWAGFWVDAASALRMREDSIIVLDPLNYNQIEEGIHSGIKKFIGGNCTVSLLLLAIGGLLQNNLVDWISTVTYQAASGGGVKHMRELLDQNSFLDMGYRQSLGQDILEIERRISQDIKKRDFPNQQFDAPLSYSLIPWIDENSYENDGNTKEENKAHNEANKILAPLENVCIDSTCVRVGSLRCHSQSVMMK